MTEQAISTLPNTEDGEDVIGRASATEREPNTADKFSFWIRPGERLNPFDIVAAEHLEKVKPMGWSLISVTLQMQQDISPTLSLTILVSLWMNQILHDREPTWQIFQYYQIMLKFICQCKAKHVFDLQMNLVFTMP